MEITSSSTAGLAGGSIGKLREVVGQGIARLALLKHVWMESVRRLIKAVGQQCRKVRDKLSHDVFGIFPVPVNHGMSDSIFAAIRAGGFDIVQYLGISPGEIRLGDSGQTERTVHEVNLNRAILSHDLVSALKKRGRWFGLKAGFRPVDPLTALRFAAAYPGRQRKHPLAVSFIDGNGVACWLYFYESAGKRHFCCLRGSPGLLKSDFRFLAVRG